MDQYIRDHKGKLFIDQNKKVVILVGRSENLFIEYTKEGNTIIPEVEYGFEVYDFSERCKYSMSQKTFFTFYKLIGTET